MVVLAWPGRALAGPEINIPRAEDGPGIKVGQRSTFHPGFALVTGVDTNVFSEDSAAPLEDPNAAAFLMPTGWMGVGNRQFRDGLLMSPPERTERNLDYYFGTILGFRQYLAKNRNILGQSRLSGGVQARLAFLPGRRFSVNFDGDLFRYSQPPNYEAQPQYNFNRIDWKGQLTFIGRPGGGRFGIQVGLRNQALKFENRTDDPYLRRGDRVLAGFITEAKWRFLPKSAIVFSYGMDWTYYTQCCVEIGFGRNEDNFAHRIVGGFRGQVFKKVILDALAGYGLGYYRSDPNGPNFSSVIGELSLTYFPNARSLFNVALYRSFQDSLLGNYYIDLGARLQARYEFKWRMIGTVGTWVAGRRYAGLAVLGFEDGCDTADTNGDGQLDRACPVMYTGTGADQFQRRDTLFNLNLKLEQPIKRIWSVALQYDMAIDVSDFQTEYLAPFIDENQMYDERPAIDFAGFNRHVVMILGAVRI
ncbi:MAG: hypothetical protein H6712_26700 [Myxococcales bacterium]|nr:hypothetical protein [Myxococcales bacterium]